MLKVVLIGLDACFESAITGTKTASDTDPLGRRIIAVLMIPPRGGALLCAKTRRDGPCSQVPG